MSSSRGSERFQPRLSETRAAVIMPSVMFQAGGPGFATDHLSFDEIQAIQVCLWRSVPS